MYVIYTCNVINKTFAEWLAFNTLVVMFYLSSEPISMRIISVFEKNVGKSIFLGKWFVLRSPFVSEQPFIRFFSPFRFFFPSKTIP